MSLKLTPLTEDWTQPLVDSPGETSRREHELLHKLATEMSGAAKEFIRQADNLLKEVTEKEVASKSGKFVVEWKQFFEDFFEEKLRQASDQNPANASIEQPSQEEEEQD